MPTNEQAMPERPDLELQVGDEVVDEGGQNGVGIVTRVDFGSVEADWKSHRFDGTVRGTIGKRWIRRIATAEEVAARTKEAQGEAL